jgi:uncharacterized protein YceK
MKPILLFALLTILLAGCASLSDLRRSAATKTAEIPGEAVDLSYCTLRAMEVIDSPYVSHLSGHPAHQEFFIT